MIDDALKEELKTAGYPWPDCPCPDFSPSLESLIEICGSRFKSLTPRGEGFVAHGMIGMTEHDSLFRGKGDSPAEAVARLYVALQQQDGTTKQ